MRRVVKLLFPRYEDVLGWSLDDVQRHAGLSMTVTACSAAGAMTMFYVLVMAPDAEPDPSVVSLAASVALHLLTVVGFLLSRNMAQIYARACYDVEPFLREYSRMCAQEAEYSPVLDLSLMHERFAREVATLPCLHQDMVRAHIQNHASTMPDSINRTHTPSPPRAVRRA